VVTGATVVTGAAVETVAAEALGAAADDEGERPGDAGLGVPPQATAKEITAAAQSEYPSTIRKLTNTRNGVRMSEQGGR